MHSHQEYRHHVPSLLEDVTAYRSHHSQYHSFATGGAPAPAHFVHPAYLPHAPSNPQHVPCGCGCGHPHQFQPPLPSPSAPHHHLGHHRDGVHQPPHSVASHHRHRVQHRLGLAADGRDHQHPSHYQPNVWEPYLQPERLDCLPERGRGGAGERHRGGEEEGIISRLHEERRLQPPALASSSSSSSASAYIPQQRLGPAVSRQGVLWERGEKTEAESRLGAARHHLLPYHYQHGPATVTRGGEVPSWPARTATAAEAAAAWPEGRAHWKKRTRPEEEEEEEEATVAASGEEGRKKERCFLLQEGGRKEARPRRREAEQGGERLATRREERRREEGGHRGGGGGGGGWRRGEQESRSRSASSSLPSSPVFGATSAASVSRSATPAAASEAAASRRRVRAGRPLRRRRLGGGGGRRSRRRQRSRSSPSSSSSPSPATSSSSALSEDDEVGRGCESIAVAARGTPTSVLPVYRSSATRTPAAAGTSVGEEERVTPPRTDEGAAVSFFPYGNVGVAAGKGSRKDLEIPSSFLPQERRSQREEDGEERGVHSLEGREEKRPPEEEKEEPTKQQDLVQSRRRLSAASPTLSDEELKHILQLVGGGGGGGGTDDQGRESGSSSSTLASRVGQQKQLVTGGEDGPGAGVVGGGAGGGFLGAHPTSQQLEHPNSSGGGARALARHGGGAGGKKGSSPLIPKSDQQHQSFKAAAEKEESRVREVSEEEEETEKDNAQSKQLESGSVSMSGGDRRTRDGDDGDMELVVIPQQPHQVMQQQQGTVANDAVCHSQQQQQVCLLSGDAYVSQGQYAMGAPFTPVDGSYPQQATLIQFQAQQQQQQPMQQQQQQPFVFQMSGLDPTTASSSTSPYVVNTSSGVSPGQSSTDSGYVYGVDFSPAMSVQSSLANPASVMSSTQEDAGFAGSPASESWGRQTAAANFVPEGQQQLQQHQTEAEEGLPMNKEEELSQIRDLEKYLDDPAGQDQEMQHRRCRGSGEEGAHSTTHYQQEEEDPTTLISRNQRQGHAIGGKANNPPPAPTPKTCVVEPRVVVRIPRPKRRPRRNCYGSDYEEAGEEEEEEETCHKSKKRRSKKRKRRRRSPTCEEDRGRGATANVCSGEEDIHSQFPGCEGDDDDGAAPLCSPPPTSRVGFVETEDGESECSGKQRRKRRRKRDDGGEGGGRDDVSVRYFSSPSSSEAAGRVGEKEDVAIDRIKVVVGGNTEEKEEGRRGGGGEGFFSPSAAFASSSSSSLLPKSARTKRSGEWKKSRRRQENSECNKGPFSERKVRGGEEEEASTTTSLLHSHPSSSLDGDDAFPSSLHSPLRSSPTIKADAGRGFQPGQWQQKARKNGGSVSGKIIPERQTLKTFRGAFSSSSPWGAASAEEEEPRKTAKRRRQKTRAPSATAAGQEEHGEIYGDYDCESDDGVESTAFVAHAVSGSLPSFGDLAKTAKERRDNRRRSSELSLAAATLTKSSGGLSNTVAKILASAERTPVIPRPPPAKRKRGRPTHYQKLQEALWFKQQEEKRGRQRSDSVSSARTPMAPHEDANCLEKEDVVGPPPATKLVKIPPSFCKLSLANVVYSKRGDAKERSQERNGGGGDVQMAPREEEGGEMARGGETVDVDDPDQGREEGVQTQGEKENGREENGTPSEATGAVPSSSLPGANDDYDDLFNPISGLNDEEPSFTAEVLYSSETNRQNGRGGEADAAEQQQKQATPDADGGGQPSSFPSMPLFDEVMSSQDMTDLENLISMHVEKHRQQEQQQKSSKETAFQPAEDQVTIGNNNFQVNASTAELVVGVPPSAVLRPRQQEQENLAFAATSTAAAVVTAAAAEEEVEEEEGVAGSMTTGGGGQAGQHHHNRQHISLQHSSRGKSAPDRQKHSSNLVSSLRAAARFRGANAEAARNRKKKVDTREQEQQADMEELEEETENEVEEESRQHRRRRQRRQPRPEASAAAVVVRDEDSDDVEIIHETELTGSSSSEWLVCKMQGCSFWTRKPERMSRHLDCHEDRFSRHFVCPDCDFRTPSLAKMLKHDRIEHTGIKDYECRLCGAEVTDIAVHLKIHKDEKPFSCQMCDLHFRHKNSLVRHMMRHSGERPYICNHCRKTFNNVDRMREHVKMEHGPKTTKGDASLTTPRKRGRPRKYPLAEPVAQTAAESKSTPTPPPSNRNQPPHQQPQYSFTIAAPQTAGVNAFSSFGTVSAGQATPAAGAELGSSTLLVQNFAYDPITGQQTPILSAIHPQQIIWPGAGQATTASSTVQQASGQAQQSPQTILLAPQLQQNLLSLPATTTTTTAPSSSLNTTYVDAANIPIEIIDVEEGLPSVETAASTTPHPTEPPPSTSAPLTLRPKEVVLELAMEEITGHQGGQSVTVSVAPSAASDVAAVPTTDQSKPTNPVLAEESRGVDDDDDAGMLQEGLNGIKEKEAIIREEEVKGDSSSKAGEVEEEVEREEKEEEGENAKEEEESYSRKLEDLSVVARKEGQEGEKRRAAADAIAKLQRPKKTPPPQESFRCEKCGFASKYERFFTIHQKRKCV